MTHFIKTSKMDMLVANESNLEGEKLLVHFNSFPPKLFCCAATALCYLDEKSNCSMNALHSRF